MNTNWKHLLIPAMIAVAAPASARSFGAPQGHSGAPGESTCVACHGGSPNTGPGRVRVEFPGGASYSPGARVRLRVTVEDPNARRWGFQLTARTESNSTAGALATANDNTQVLRDGALQWITHTVDGTAQGTRNSAPFEFDWTAPEASAGPVVFYVAGNAANGNGSPTGDLIYTASLRVTPAASVSRPGFTSSSVVDIFTGRPGMAPGAVVAIEGAELAAREAAWSPVSGRPFDTTLGGIAVKIDNVAVPLISVSPTRIVLLVPGATPLGDVPVAIERDGRAGEPVTVRVTPAAPAIRSVVEPQSEPRRFHASVTTAGAGAVLGFIAARGLTLGRPEFDPQAVRGVFPGESIDIYATGLGATNGSFPTDRLFTGTFAVANLPMVRFGDLTVVPDSAELVAPGVYVVRVRVPETLASGGVPLQLDVSGAASAANVLLNVERAPQ